MNAVPSPPRDTVSVVTASYAADFERCRLLCETLDRRVTGFDQHLILVAGHDVARFEALASKNRIIVDERDLLPRWLHVMRDPTSLAPRHMWLSFRTKPLRGWHVQQLRRMAIADHVRADALLYCDSDVVFLREFDCATLWQPGGLRFLRRPGALADPKLAPQRLWSANAGRALGIDADRTSLEDYIATVIAWRRDTLAGMCSHIEAVHGRHWVEAVASTRDFSECMLYGRYVDEVLGGAGHSATAEELCHIYWNGPRLNEADLDQFIAGMAPGQVALGLQSFVGTDLGSIRRLIGAA
ncbi:MAG: DUF6492 family protein [Rhizobiaceae bacterium]